MIYQNNDSTIHQTRGEKEELKKNVAKTPQKEHAVEESRTPDFCLCSLQGKSPCERPAERLV